MIRIACLFFLIFTLASCGPKTDDREQRRQARLDSILKADSAYKAGIQHREYLKALEDSQLQAQSYRDEIVRDSLEKAAELQKLKWKKREPPKPAPKKMKKGA